MLGADPQQSGPRFIIHRDTAAFAARSDPGPITPSSVSHGIGPTLIHIKLRAGVWVCPCKALSIDPIDAAEPSEPSHDQYGKPIGTVTLARNSRMRSTEGYCRSNNQREPKGAAVSSMRQEKPHSLSYQPMT